MSTTGRGQDHRPPAPPGGILTAIGGFVDIGDLVANSAAGARFELNLAWVVVVGVVGIVVYAEMCGRVAAIAARPVFDLVRERLGPRFGLANLLASFFINFLTLTAELAGVAIAVSLLVGVSYLLLIPVALFLVWLVIWRMPFERIERVFGLAGLALLVFAVTVWHLGPDWSQLLHDIRSPRIPQHETVFTYGYYAIALFGAAMTPYEVFFFSSGAVEEHWTRESRPRSGPPSRRLCPPATPSPSTSAGSGESTSDPATRRVSTSSCSWR